LLSADGSDWRRSIGSIGPEALFEQPAANDAILGGIRIPFALLAPLYVPKAASLTKLVVVS
jgi:hypothetical protein